MPFLRGILIIGVLAILVAGAQVAFWQRQQETTTPSFALLLEECQKEHSAALDFSCLRKRAREFIGQYGVALTMTHIENMGEVSNGIGGTMSCHDVGHLVGEIGVEVTGDVGATIIECQRTCGFGCAHGAAVGALLQTPALVSDLSSVCKKFEASSFPGQEWTACNHGLGHGLSEVAQRDIKKALHLCDRLDGESASEACATGVFMEMIEGPVLDRPGTLLKLPDDIPSFCKTLPGRYADICLINVGSYEYKRSGNLQKSFELCENIPLHLTRNCVRDLGTDFHFMFHGDVQKIWEACRVTTKEQIELCIEGAIISGLVTDPSGVLGRELCQTIEQGFQKECFRYVSESLLQIR